MSRDSLSLSELIDLEVAAEADRSRPPDTLRERDQKLGFEMQGRFGRPLAEVKTTELLRNWVSAAVPSPTPGTRFVGFLDLTDLMLLVLGLLMGGSTSAALLHYDGSTPINAIQYLGVFVVLQGLLLLLLLVHILWGGRLGVVQEVLRSFAYVRSRLFERIEGGLTALRRVHNVYHRPEQWLIMKVTQRFAAAFHLGALAVTISLVGFTDLAFSWSTTLNLSAETFHQILSAFAWPWQFLGEDWQLSLEQVRHTQYFRLEGIYLPWVNGKPVNDAALVGSWWRYLVAAQVTYGLVPRLVLWFLSRSMFTRSLRAIRLDGLAFGAIRRRLLEAIQPPLDAGSTTDLRAEGRSRTVSPSASGPCRAVTWRDFPATADQVGSYLSEKFSLQPISVHPVGGNAEDIDGQKILTSAAGDAAPWVILVEDWESPGKAFKTLVQRLRSHAPAREVYVIPVKLDAGKMTRTSNERFDLWRRHVDGMADPGVGVIA